MQTLILALGASASRGLLEALAAEQDRGRRLRLIELAASLGAAIVPETRRLLADPRWYVVRNMVLLLRRVQDRSAMTEILRCAGKQFDPRVTEAFERVLPRIEASAEALEQTHRAEVAAAGLGQLPDRAGLRPQTVA